MLDYRLYMLTAGDRIDQAVVFSCATDDRAISEAHSNFDLVRGAELWQAARLVLRVPPPAQEGTPGPQRSGIAAPRRENA